MITLFSWVTEKDPRCWDCEHYYEDPYNSGPETQKCEKDQNMNDCDSCQLFEQKKLGDE